MPGLGPRSSTAIELVVGKSEGALRRGLLWIQEDKLFSRWRERFVVLTNTHIVVHKKAASRISEMGAFLYKVGGSPACQQANAANSECRDRRNLSKKLPGSRFDREGSVHGDWLKPVCLLA